MPVLVPDWSVLKWAPSRYSYLRSIDLDQVQIQVLENEMKIINHLHKMLVITIEKQEL